MNKKTIFYIIIITISMVNSIKIVVVLVQLMTVERIHPKAPVMLIFNAIFTCLPSCINLSNTRNIYEYNYNK